ncbi:MAG: hypothetical protein Q8M58_07155, partial [Anaerolineales bacterium]|nr:hypothetical protein [Anaerolineales bacterium]
PATAAPTASQPVTTTLDGQTLLQERCTVCHSLSRVTSKHKTADQWKTTIERMVGKGAQGDATSPLLLYTNPNPLSFNDTHLPCPMTM